MPCGNLPNGQISKRAINFSWRNSINLVCDLFFYAFWRGMISTMRMGLLINHNLKSQMGNNFPAISIHFGRLAQEKGKISDRVVFSGFCICPYFNYCYYDAIVQMSLRFIFHLSMFIDKRALIDFLVKRVSRRLLHIVPLSLRCWCFHHFVWVVADLHKCLSKCVCFGLLPLVCVPHYHFNIVFSLHSFTRSLCAYLFCGAALRLFLSLHTHIYSFFGSIRHDRHGRMHMERSNEWKKAII